jgi:PAS domain S-box-containing protein
MIKNFKKEYKDLKSKLKILEEENKFLLKEQKTILKTKPEKKVEEQTIELKEKNKELQKEIDERIQIEKDLKESEERFRRLSDSSIEGIVITEKGKILDANNRLSEMLGIKIKDLIGKNVMDFVAPESRELVLHKIKIKHEGIYEHKALRKDGTIFPVEVEGKTIPYKRRFARVTAVRDLTERKKLEQHLRESEKKFKHLVENLPDAIFICRIGDNNPGEILDVNPIAENQTGYSRNELLGMNILKDLSADIMPKIKLKQSENKILKGETVRFTEKKRRKDGTEYWTEVTLTGITWQNEMVALSVNRDITDKKQAEDSLRESEEKYRTLVENMSDGIIQVDNEEVVQFVNNKMCDMIGYPAEKLLGKYASELLLDKKGQLFQQQNIKKRKKKIFNQYEIQLSKKSGEKIWVNVNGGPILDSNGNVIGSMGIHSDITERKQTEEFIFNIAKGVSAATGEMFFRSLVNHIANNLDADYAFVGELKKDNPNIVQTIAVFAEGQDADNFEYDLANTPCAEVIGKKMCAYPKDVQKLFPLDFLLIDMGVNAYVATPLFDSNGNPLGIFCVLFKNAIANIERIKLMLQIFGVRASAEMERKQTEEALQQLSKDQATLLEISKTLTASLDVNTVLQNIIDKSTQLCDLDTGAIYIVQGDELYLGAATPPIPPDFPEVFRRALIVEHPNIRKAISTRRPHILPDMEAADLSPAEQAIKESRNMRTLIYVPLTIKKKVVGVLILGTIKESRSFSRHEIDLYRTLSNQAVLAIENARLFDKTQHYVSELEQRILEREQAEEMLRKSEMKYQDLYDNAPDMYISIDAATKKILQCNNKVTSVLSYDKDDIIGHPIFSFYHSDSLEKAKKAFQKFMANGMLHDIELQVKKKDGSTLDVSLNASAVYGEDGKIIFSRSIWRDITDRKIAAKKLKTSEEQVRLLLDSTAEAIYGLDLKGNCTFVNQACLDFLGYKSSEDLLSKNMHNIIHHTYPDGSPYPEKECNIHRAFIKSEGVHIDDEVLWRADGTSFPAEYWSYPIFREGDIIGSVVTFLDITDRKLVEDALADSEEKYRNLVETSQDLIFRCDSAGRFIYLNPAWKKTLGYKLDEMLGRAFGEFKTPEQSAKDLEKFKSILAGQDTFGYETIYLSKTGEDVHLIFNARILKDSSGKVIGTQGTAHNITDRKHAEEKIRKSEQKLLLHIEKTPMAVIDWDTNLNVKTWNPAAEKIFGYTKKQALGKNAKDLIIPDSVEEHVDVVWAELKANKGGTRSINENNTKDGQIITCDWYNTPLVNEKGQVFGITSMVDDITDRIQSENRLRESEEKFHSLFDDAINMIHIFDTEGTIIDANKAQIEKLGYTKEELLGENIIEILDLGDVDKEKINVQESLQETIKGTGLSGYEIAMVTKTGEKFIVESNVTPQFADGKVVAYRGIATDITERKRLENTLKQSEFLLKESQRVASLGSYVLNMKTGLWACSDVLDDIFGIDNNYKKDVNGWLQVVHPEYQDEMQVYFTKNVLTEHKSFNKEYKILRIRNKAERWVHGLGELEFDTEGNLIKMIGTIQDITERKHVEEALFQSEEKYRTLYNSMVEGLCLHEIVYDKLDQAIDYKIIDVNPSYEKFTGLRKETAIGALASELYKAGEPPYLDIYAKVAKTGKSTSFETYFPPLDKHFYITVFSPAKGKFATLFFDISDRRRSEENIRKLSLSVEQSPALVIITDLEGNIEYVNRKFLEVTGYSINEVLGQNPRILKSDKTPQSEYKRLWETITSGEVWTGEFHNKKKNGKLYYERASISPIKNENGDITHFVSVKEDITERKELQKQLNQAQKMEAIGQLAGGVAHDFNNLLTIINGHAELTLMDMEPENPMYQDISTILESGERASDLTRQLLAFSRMQPISPRIMDANMVIKELDKMIRRLIGEDIKIKTDLFPDLPRIKADPGQLEQILMNLIINARDALNEKTGLSYKKRIVIKTEKFLLDKLSFKRFPGCKAGLYVQLSVTDNGIGMDEDTLKKIFEPFYTTKQVGKGTGLGLSTVYGIAKQNEGFVYVDSIPGSETTFKVLWPVSKEHIVQVDKKKSIKESHMGDETILLVEDDDGVRNFSSVTLNKLGYKVYESSNGRDAIKLVKDKKLKINLVITDIIMPGMDGKELSANLKKLLPGIKVLYTSGYIDDPIIRSSLSDKKINFINKPFSVNKLAAEVRKILDR